MKKLVINLENCYGISKLEHTFDFEWDKKSYEIYAPNWTMKTSFAKTFKDFSEWRETKDLIYEDRKTIREINDENWEEIKKEGVFVIESYNESFRSKNMSYLLVNQDLKGQYDEIIKNILQEKEGVLKEIKNISWSSDCENEIIESFSNWRNINFLDVLGEITELLYEEQEVYNFKYNDIFDKWDKVKTFLSKNKDYIKEYTENYNKMISQSEFFTNTENKFWTYQAKNILKSVSDDKFFKAWHKFKLKNWKEISTSKEYQEIIDLEIKKIIQSDELKSIFEKIDDELSKNESMRKFKEIIEERNDILVELDDFEWFRQKVRINYLSQKKDIIKILLDLYNSKKEELNVIIEQAKKSETMRQHIIDEFNDRFSNMPFKLSIKNKEDVILKTAIPTINFTYNDWRLSWERTVNDPELNSVLSQWEKRALYLLNIIFDIQARKTLQQETLLIIDDIADSFDYKNKYSIIQYLKDLSEDPLFSMIILTHNFDFFRTICFRKIAEWEYCQIVTKYVDKIVIEDVGFLRFFDNLKIKIEQGIEGKDLISLIPFTRNLAEYILNNHIKDELNSFLHIKSDTMEKTVWNLMEIIKSIFCVSNVELNNIDSNRLIIDFIFDIANNILEEEVQSVNLENKIVLSIAIRLKVELFIIGKINDDIVTWNIKSHQTMELIKEYQKRFPDDVENKKLFEKVILMTPENIHINAFMYEPIIDMWENELRKLYKEVSVLS